MLQVSWPRTVDKDGITVDLASARREVGGPVAVARGEPVHMRVFLDHSALEACTPPDPGAAAACRQHQRDAHRGVCLFRRCSWARARR